MDKRRRTLFFEVTFCWLIGKLSLSSFVPAQFFLILKTDREKDIEIQHDATMVEFQDAPDY